MKHLLICAAATAALCALPPAALGQKFVIKPVAEKKVKALPPGPLFWRVETLPDLEKAQAAAGPTALAAEVSGKAWLFTLGPKGGATPGATPMAEIGPVPPIQAAEYLLRINNTGGPSGVKTSVHAHPGSEAFYILSGRLSQRTPAGMRHVESGGIMNGNAADVPMEVSSSGAAELNALVMFVVDAGRPFSTPAKLP